MAIKVVQGMCQSHDQPQVCSIPQPHLLIKLLLPSLQLLLPSLPPPGSHPSSRPFLGGSFCSCSEPLKKSHPTPQRTAPAHTSESLQPNQRDPAHTSGHWDTTTAPGTPTITAAGLHSVLCAPSLITVDEAFSLPS